MDSSIENVQTIDIDEIIIIDSQEEVVKLDKLTANSSQLPNEKPKTPTDQIDNKQENKKIISSTSTPTTSNCTSDTTLIKQYSETESIKPQQKSTINSNNDDEIKPSTSTVDDHKTSIEMINNLDDFEIKIKEQLNENFNEDFSLKMVKLKEFLAKFGDFNNKGIKMLINEFYELIKDEPSIERKREHFHDLIKELRCFLAKKTKIDNLTALECRKRKIEIKKVKKELEISEKKLKILKKTEINFSDPLNEEDDVLDKIDRLQKKIVRLYKKLRNLENKYVYFGEDEIQESDFDDLTENEQLNRLVSKEILVKFKKDNQLPNYIDIADLIDKYLQDNRIQLDSKLIVKKIYSKLKEYRQNRLEFILDSFLYDDNLNYQPAPIETEELKCKLDAQNNFKEKLDEIVSRFLEKNKRVEDGLSDYQTSESEEDENEDDDKDDGDDETISDSELEFISTKSTDEDADKITDKQTNEPIVKHDDKVADKEKDKETDKQMDNHKLTGGQTDKPVDESTDNKYDKIETDSSDSDDVVIIFDDLETIEKPPTSTVNVHKSSIEIHSSPRSEESINNDAENQANNQNEKRKLKPGDNFSFNFKKTKTTKMLHDDDDCIILE